MAKPVSKSKEEINPHRPNFWGMMRDVLVTSLNKGQFLIGMGGFILIIALLKMPSTEIPKLFYATIELFKTSYMYGWITTSLVVPGSVWYFNRTRKLHNKQIERLTKGKNH